MKPVEGTLSHCSRKAVRVVATGRLTEEKWVVCCADSGDGAPSLRAGRHLNCARKRREEGKCAERGAERTAAPRRVPALQSLQFVRCQAKEEAAEGGAPERSEPRELEAEAGRGAEAAQRSPAARPGLKLALISGKAMQFCCYTPEHKFFLYLYKEQCVLIHNGLYCIEWL